MKAVWKWEFPITDHPQTVPMPHAAVPVAVQIQGEGESICLWAEVWPDAPRVARRFAVHGTGHPIRVSERHIGTAQDGALVWHLYEVYS